MVRIWILGKSPAAEENKPYFLLRGRPQKKCTKPAMALKSDKVHTWTWDNLKLLIDQTG